MNSEGTTVKGTVTQAYARGFQLHGRAEWYNWSKYAQEPRTLPAPGHVVSAVLDKAGFVREVQINGGVSGNTVAPHPVERTATPQLAYDARLRLDCLKMALESQQWLGDTLTDIGEAFDRAEVIERWAKGETS